MTIRRLVRNSIAKENPVNAAHDVLAQLLDAMASKKWEQLPDLYAEDVVIEHPLSGPDATVRGRDKVREHAARLATVGDLAIETVAVHETDDPEVVIHEFTNRATFDGEQVTMAGIRVMRVRDGVIVSSRDYGNRR